MNGLPAGSIELFAGLFTPRTFSSCKGQTLSIGPHNVLYSAIGTRFGGDGRTDFDLPNIPDLKTDTGAGIEFVIEMEGTFGQGGWGSGIGTGTIGEIILTATDYAPRGFVLCNGASYSTTEQSELFGVIGYQYGGMNDEFKVPTINPIVSEGSDGTITAYIRVNDQVQGVSPYLATLMLWPTKDLPSSAWAECNGQSIAIADNAALFSLLGKTYGQDDGTHFKLPSIADLGGVSYLICTSGLYPARN